MNAALIHASAIQDVDSQEHIVAFLYDAQTSCFIQKGDVTVNLIRRHFTSASHKDKAVRLLERLKSRNRFLSCLTIDPLCPLRGMHYCQSEFDHADIVLAASQYCAQNPRCSDSRQWLVDDRRSTVLRYDYTRFNITDSAEWQERIIQPVLRFGRKVSIIDYKMGERMANSMPTIKWIQNVFMSHGKPQGAFPFDILTSFPNKYAERQAVEWARGEGIRILARRYDPNIDRSLPHDRYLITDGIGLMIGRGFNLHTGVRIRESAIYIAEDSASALNKAHSALLPTY